MFEGEIASKSWWKRPYRYSNDAPTVQRVPRGYLGDEKAPLIPDTASLPPESYQIVLRDKQGKMVGWL